MRNEELEKNPVSRRLRGIKPFLAMEILEEAELIAREGEPIVHLEVGEPDLPAPAEVVEAAEAALRAGITRYTHSLGVGNLRQAICDYYARTYGVDVKPGRVIVTEGSSPGLLLALAALVDPGDQVLVPDPHYAAYPNFVLTLSGEPVFLPLSAESGWIPDPEDFRRAIGPRTRAMIVNSPANPTGAVCAPDVLRAMAGLDVPVISDEIYHGLTYGEPAHTMLEYTDDCFVLDGFSKRYGMTGFRLGWLVAPERYVRPIQSLAQNLFISANAFVQAAGVVALCSPACAREVERRAGVYDERRRFLLARLGELGLKVPREPHGAYYVLADARHLGPDSLALARRILREARVGLTPGADFGQRVEGHLRISYANSIENLREGTDRIERWLKGLPTLPGPK